MVFDSSIAIVSWTYTARNGRQRTSDSGDAGVHIAHDHGATSVKRGELFRTRSEESLHLAPVGELIHPHVDDGRPRA